jgi:hypothetical protein
MKTFHFATKFTESPHLLETDKLFSIQIGTPKFLKASGQQGTGNGEYPI